MYVVQLFKAAIINMYAALTCDPKGLDNTNSVSQNMQEHLVDQAQCTNCSMMVQEFC